MDYPRLAKFAKYFLIVVNIIVVIFGVLAIATGVIGLFGGDQVLPVIVVLLLIGGSIIVFLGVLGYRGARQENSRLLKIYGAIMLGLLVAKFVAFTITLLYTGHLLSGVPKPSDIKEVFDNYGQDPSTADAIDQIQRKFSCCGFYEPISMQRPDGTYPSSCCFWQEEQCRLPFSDGCSSQIGNNLLPFVITGWVIFAVSLVVHILLTIMAFYFASITQRKTDVQQLQPLHKYTNL